ncbi:MAG: minor capsid protein [Ruminococcus sp.]|nr:minor capsid protein [Ruminococcus sp.]
MSDYDISGAFKAIENELIDSMMRNFSRHRAEETKEGYNWAQWQAEQLKSLEQYRKSNAKKFNKQFSEINSKISEMLKTARADGNASQEAKILTAIKNGFNGPSKPSASSTAEFFKVNDRKLNALIKATTNDLKKAETAILRMSNDKYRKAIYNAHVYANTGAGTYEKAVDMACKDMLKAGLNCVEYKNGARHTLSDYADMAIRTANKRAYLYGEGEKRAEWGITTVVVNQRQGGCPDCANYIGQVFIDDVYSNGKKTDGDYPLLSKAIEGGLFHPRCKDSTSTYYEGITTLKKVSKSELEAMKGNEVLEQQKSNAENQAEKCERIAKYSLDEDNQKVYQSRAEKWQNKADEIGERINKSVAKSAESDIIKSIDIDDYEVVTYGKGIKDEVNNAIIENIKICEDKGNFIISEISAKSIPSTVDGTPVLQIEMLSNGLLRLNLNTDKLAEKTLDEINDMFVNSKISVVNSLEEAIIHESGHAMSIFGKSNKDVQKFYDTLSKIHIEGISLIAYNDGAEALAELEVLRSRGAKVSEEMIDFYEKYMGRKF